MELPLAILEFIDRDWWILGNVKLIDLHGWSLYIYTKAMKIDKKQAYSGCEWYKVRTLGKSGYRPYMYKKW